jgi:hypothetical protein
MDDLEHILDEQASARGVEAWEIASALRKAYSSIVQTPFSTT